jgi:hypothetical protein
MEILFKTESFSKLPVHISFTNASLAIEVRVKGLTYKKIQFCL